MLIFYVHVEWMIMQDIPDALDVCCGYVLIDHALDQRMQGIGAAYPPKA